MRLLRKWPMLLGLAVLFFVAAGLSLALNGPRVLGFVFLALGVLAALTAFIVALAGFSRLRTEQAALMRNALAEQQRRTGSTAPDRRE
jgi:hypothetical protein